MYVCMLLKVLMSFISVSSENSFSSDSSHDYCVPPENISPPEPPPHSDIYDEVEGLYVEVSQALSCICFFPTVSVFSQLQRKLFVGAGVAQW